MNTLMEWLGSEAWTHVVKALLHTLWLGAIAVVVVAGLLRRATDPLTRYRVCLGGLFAIVLGALMAWAVLRYEPPRPQAIPDATISPVATQPGPGVSAEPVTTFSVTGATPQPKFHWIPWLALLWLAGTVLMLIRAACRVADAERLRRASTPVQQRAVLDVVDELRQKLGIARKIRVALTEQLLSPAVVGVWVPTLIIPLSLLTTLSPGQLQMILLHELAHIRRNDYFINLCQLVAESILFFNPAVWWISRQIRVEREACCDAIAIAVAGQKLEYAQTLASVAEHISAALPNTAMAFGNRRHESGLLDRIRRLLEPGYRPAIRLTWKALAGSLFCGTILLLTSAAGTFWTVTAAARLLTPEQRIERIETTMRKMGEPMLPELETNEEIPVSGRIKTADGSPLPPSAAAHFATFKRNGSGTYGCSMDKSGNWKATVSKGDLYFCASADGFAPAAFGPINTRTSNRVDNMEVVLDRGFEVRVRVMDELKQPLRGADVRALFYVHNASSFPPSAGTTDAAGEATLRHCSTLPMSVIVRSPGFETVNQKFENAKAGDVLEIFTRPALPISGTVVSKITGKPLPGARCYLLAAHGNSAETGQNPNYLRDPIATANAEGRFAITRFAKNTRYWLLFDAPGHEHKILPSVRVGVTNLLVELGSEMIVKGTFTGKLSQLHPKGKQRDVWITQKYEVGERSTHTVGFYVPVRVSDNVGHFEFTNKLAGLVTFNTAPRSHERLLTNSVDNLLIELKPPSADTNKMRDVLFRFVHPSGVAPKGSVSISLPSNEPFTAYSKYIEITNGEVRVQTIVDRMLGYAPHKTIGFTFKEEYMTRVPEGPEPLIISVPVIPAGAIYAQARNVDGTLARDCFFSVITLKRSPLVDAHWQFSSNDGFSHDGLQPRQFVATPLPLKGQYAIIAHRTNNFCVSEPIELTDAAPDHKVELQFRKGTRFVGQIIPVDGQPLAGVEVKLSFHYNKNSGFGLSSASTDGKGQFTFEDCTPDVGEYLVEVHHPGTRSVRQSVNFKKLPIKLELKPGLNLSGQVVQAGTGRPLLGTEIRAIPEDPLLPMETERTDDAGRFRFNTLNDMKYRFYVDGAYFTHGSPLLKAGQTEATNVLEVTVNQGTRVKLGEKAN